jgi:hypothetical protein
MKKNRAQKSAYARAKSEVWSANFLAFIAFLVLAAFDVAEYTTTPMMKGTNPNPLCEVVVAALGTLFEAVALAVVLSSTKIALLQMQQARDQAEDQRSTDLALAKCPTQH